MKRKRIQQLLGCILVLLLISTIGLRALYAENFADPAPTIQPATSNGLSVLFDNTHGQTAGAADWVIDGGFSDYAEALANEGYTVTELRKNTPITCQDLQSYNVFVIPEANIPYKATEQAAILQYVQNGGAVFFIADHYNADRNKNRWDASEVFNGYRRGAYNNPASGMSQEEAASGAMEGVVSSDWLAANFGVRFRYNALSNIIADMIVSPDECFGITDNVTAVAMHAGSTIAIIDPTIAKGVVYLPSGLTAGDRWPNAVDDGVYNGGGLAEGAYVAISKVGLGKAAFIGDSSAVEDATPKYNKEETGGIKATYDGFSEADDAVLLVQLTDWLADQEDYTSLCGQDITLDTATALYSYETPGLSVEPQSEPWTAPAAGYKWYDPSTFKSGSYGYMGSAAIEEYDTYTLAMPPEIFAGRELPLTVYFSGLAADTVYSGYRIGAYLPGGTQIAVFSLDGSTWGTSCGYSTAFSMAADGNGAATKTIRMRVSDFVDSTEAYFRIKSGSTNKLTQLYSLE